MTDVRAVGASKGRADTGVWGGTDDLNRRIDAIETLVERHGSTQADHHRATMRILGELKDVIGSPGDGPDGERKPSGIFAHLAAHDRRIRRGERLWERGLGFGIAAGPALMALWWFAGDKVGRLFHGP